MKAYRLTDLALQRPVTIIADDHDHAAMFVIQALTVGFGQMPSVRYVINEWNAVRSTDQDARAAVDLSQAGLSGILQKHEHFWDTHDPFGDF